MRRDWKAVESGLGVKRNIYKRPATMMNKKDGNFLIAPPARVKKPNT